jgi:hypothetical protein
LANSYKRWRTNDQRQKTGLLSIILAFAISVGTLISCAKTTTTSSTPLGGSLVQNDSIITGEIKAIKSMAAGYPRGNRCSGYEFTDMGILVNPTSDKVGQIVQFRTDVSTRGLTPGQVITAHAKLTGDVERRTTLYIYDIQ